MSAQLDADRTEKQQIKTQKEREERCQDMESITRVLREHPAGETLNRIHELAAIGKAKATRILNEMLRLGEVEETEVSKGGGKAMRTYTGYKLVEATATPGLVAEETADDARDDLEYQPTTRS